jgi:RNA polymerase sigma-70 factor, ECF subfamily
MYLAKDFITEVEGYKDILRGMAYKLTNNESASQDLLQDTFYRAISNLDKFKEGTNLKAWLFTIMKNIFINGYRKKKREYEVIFQTDEISDNNLLKVGFAAETSEFILVNDTLKMALGSLKEEYRSPFMMHFEGFKYQEIAEALDIPLGTVKSRIFFARKELADFLKKQGITQSAIS